MIKGRPADALNLAEKTPTLRLKEEFLTGKQL
jgi:hypothetical protein